MNKLTEVEKAYLAGFIDGEGCIRISKGRQDGNQFEFGFKMFVIVTNANLPILEELKALAGVGIIYVYKKLPIAGKGIWKPCHRWQVVSKQARELLENIYPYVKLKKEHIKAVLEFPFNGKGHRRTEEDYNNQLQAFFKIGELNKRGLEVNKWKN